MSSYIAFASCACLFTSMLLPIASARADDERRPEPASSAATVDGLVRAQVARKAGPDAHRFAVVGDRVDAPDRQLLFLHLGEEPTSNLEGRLRALGASVGDGAWVPPVGRHPHGYLIVDAPATSIDGIASLPEVVLVRSAERRLEPLRNDLAGGTGPLGVNARALQALGFDGGGVRIAVLDSSLDVAHPDMPVPFAVQDYSNYPALDGNVQSLVTGHGTHVSGSVLGRGTASAGLYTGQAPGADLVFLKIGNDSNASASGAAMAAAIAAAVDVYDADVITASYGGFGLYNDGSEEIEQAADYAFSQGAVVFFSAGNSATSRIHASGTVGANATTSFIQVDVGSTGGTTLYFDLIWADGVSVTRDLDLHFYNSSQVEITSNIVLNEHPESPRGTESDEVYYDVSVTGPSTYYLKVENHSAVSQFFHVFSYGDQVRFNAPDPRYTVVLPSIADSAISVAAYCSRDSYVDWCGTSRNFGQTLGSVATFSSRGPRVGDDAQKPTLAAPGTAVISALDADRPYGATLWIDDDGVIDCAGPARYCALQGTSMSCPTAAGSTALLLDAFPALKGNPAAVRNLVSRTADNGIWNQDSGFGYMDVLDAYNGAVLVVDPDEGDFPVLQVTPAAYVAHVDVSIEGVEVTSGLTVSTFTATTGGSPTAVLAASYVVVRGQWALTLNPPALAPGTYDVSIRATLGGRLTPPGTVASGYVVGEPVRVLSVSPGSGPVAGGTAITITGTGYTTDDDTTVTIGGVAAASFNVVSATSIQATTPMHAAGVVNVRVSNSFGTDTLVGAFEYFDPVQVIDVDPAFGPVAGGTSVTITGSSFTTDPDTSVMVGGAAATSIHVVDSSTILAATPAGVAGLAAVVVSNSHGSATLASGFEYLGPEATCLWGTVNAGAGTVANVLFVNGGIGEPRTRRVVLAQGQRLTMSMESSPSQATARWALYAWPNAPNGASVQTQPFGLGCTAFSTPLAGGPLQPGAIFNNIGAFNALGKPTRPSVRAPTVILDLVNGIRRPRVATLQGFILDSASAAERAASVTNGIILEVP